MTIPMLESSKYRNITMIMIFDNAMGNSDFIIVTHSETYWNIDVWKMGGLLYFSPASISHDMTQPADNINSTTTRHMSTTVIRYNDVVHYAADMQTQRTESNDKGQANICQHNAIVTDDIINDEKKSSSDVSKHFCRMQMRSRYDVTRHGFNEEPIQHFVYDSSPSPCYYGNQYAAQLPEGIIINSEVEIINLDRMESSYMATQYDSGGYGTNQITVVDNLDFDFMIEKRMTIDEFIAEQSEAVATINGNSTGTRPYSSQQMNFSALRSERSTKIYNQTAVVRPCAHSYESYLISLQQASVGSIFEQFNIDSKRTGDSFLSTKSCRVQNNINALGGKCMHPCQRSLQQSSVGSKVEQFNIDSKRTGEPFLSTKYCRVQDSIQPLVPQYCTCPYSSMIVLQIIDRQEEMVVVPYDTDKIQANMDGNPKYEFDLMVMHLSTLPTLSSDGTKRNYKQMNSLPEAAPPANAEKFLSCPNSPGPIGLQAQECLYSPSAPQVEKNVLETTSTSDKCAQLAKSVEEPRMRRDARAERFMITASRNISIEEQESYYTLVPRPSGASRLSDKDNIPEDYDGKHERVFTETLRGQPAPRDIETKLLPERERQVRRLEESSGSSPPRLRVNPKIGRMAPRAPLLQLTSSSMSDTSSSGVQHPQFTVASLPEPASAGAYDNLPELVNNDDSGSDM